MIKTLRKAVELLRQTASTIHSLYFRVLPIKTTPSSYEQAINLFKADPYRCFYMDSKPVDWKNILQPAYIGHSAENFIMIDSQHLRLGYVAKISSADLGVTITIGHFAVVPECISTGVASIIVEILRKKFRDNYNTTTIIFDEHHSKFSEHNYKNFFTKLGAIKSDDNVPERWKWNIS